MEDRIQYLFERYFDKTASDTERDELKQLVIGENADHIISDIIKHSWDKYISNERYAFSDERKSEILSAILQGDEYSGTFSTIKRFHILRNVWVRYAAAIVILVGSLVFFSRTKKESTLIVTRDSASFQDILPASNKVTLTLSNGRRIVLDSLSQQTITDGNLAIRNTNGTLSYANTDVLVYNTMTTPKGGQYKLALSDGTMVWLNAESSITFPTSFSDNVRTVSITGEAYFEVAKNPRKPFIINTYKDIITVVGTSFNVNSYTDPPEMKTSLLNGSVRINNKVTLKPGEAYMAGKVIITNLEQDLSWKNGVFYFHGVKLPEAMRQLARWYDIDVRFVGNVMDVEFGGEIGRHLTLKQVLSGLRDKEVQFRLEGKTLTVTRLQS